MSHLSGEVKRLMSMLTKYDQDNYPEMLGRICIINAPMVFKAIWALVKPLLNPRTLSKIQVGAQCALRDISNSQGRLARAVDMSSDGLWHQVPNHQAMCWSMLVCEAALRKLGSQCAGWKLQLVLSLAVIQCYVWLLSAAADLSVQLHKGPVGMD